MSDKATRLDKYISQVTAYSRKDIKCLVRAAKVCVNGELVRSASIKVSSEDTVELDGKTIIPNSELYLMLYKPIGYVCAATDAMHPTVLDLLPDDLRSRSPHVAGRLDIDTTGLILLTTDGQWSHKITTPSHLCLKRYLVESKWPMDETICENFASGILLRDDTKLTRPATLEILDRHQARVSLSEGRYHQVKRMFAACQNRVISLHREAIGKLELDPILSVGEYRALNSTEVNTFNV